MTELSHPLRRLLDELLGLPVEGRPAAAGRALDRLERDLLPRTAGPGPYLVAGIVGPNNAGKSALFNALAGEELSPSKPTGGATRRLVGALHPDLLARFRAEPRLSRFPLLERARGAPLGEAGLRTERPEELLVVPLEQMPTGLLLIDTPDFDSILEDNRLASESLLAVADLALVVVTRHSYQNREVVESLQRWLAHDRPWLLVYNEAVDEDVVREHATKLAADLGSEPQGVFAAALDLEIQRGDAALRPLSIGYGGVAAGRSLSEYLFDLEQVGELKDRALAASLSQLTDDLAETAGELGADADAARAVLAAASERARDLARRAASAAMPGGPFIEAFRTVLDRRAHALTRGLRGGVRRVRLALERLPARFRGRGAAAPQPGRLDEIEIAELERSWGKWWEELCRDFGPEARDPARWRLPVDLTAALDRDLAPGGRSAVLERVSVRFREDSPDVDAFRAACEELVEHAIEERRHDWDIQAGANLAMLAPLALAAVVIIKTGGLATDAAVAGGGALGSYITEKYAHLLGSGITREASERWTTLRSAALTPRVLAAVLATSAPALESVAREGAARATRLRELAEELT